jgi:hemoglobin-like flavoprotein
MSMENRRLVKESIESIGKDMDNVSRLFFRELFHLDIRLENVLPGNVVFLNRKFSNMMGVFKNLKHLEKITDSLSKMGERHSMNYGVLPEYLPAAKQALLLALNKHFKDTFSAELELAWSQVFDETTAVMRQAMQQVAPDKIKKKEYVDSAYDPGLLEEIGGVDVVTRVHQRFYDDMFEEPWLGQFFYGKSKESLIMKQTKFMVAAFGGANEYEGDTPAFIHMHMFVTAEQADLREKILRRAILREGLSAAIADRWLTVDHAFRPAIVKKSMNECVLKCVGQFPVSAKKPADYTPDPDLA